MGNANNTDQPGFTAEDFRNFVNKFDWVFAKTYAETAPHEYIVLKKVGLEHKDNFVRAARFIREAGFEAYYYRSRRFYYILDDYYWTILSV